MKQLFMRLEIIFLESAHDLEKKRFFLFMTSIFFRGFLNEFYNVATSLHTDENFFAATAGVYRKEIAVSAFRKCKITNNDFICEV
jgi:hypothetical protein